MGQKINPISFRTGINKQWSSRWFIKDSYRKYLPEDYLIRTVIQKKINQAGIAAVEIERTASRLRVLIKAARPGLIIGRGGKGIEDLTKEIEKQLAKLRKTTGAPRIELGVNIEELKRSEISASYIAQQIAWDLEKRLPFRRIMKKYLDQMTQNKEVQGAKILLAGRLGGAEIARKESLRRGRLPLQSLRAVIDYSQATAFCTYGAIGIKVWIFKGFVGESELMKAKL